MCGSAAAALVPACRTRTPGARSVPLVPHDGKSVLGAFLSQFFGVACGNGWDQEEGGVHLVAAMCGAVAEVPMTMPDGQVINRSHFGSKKSF